MLFRDVFRRLTRLWPAMLLIVSFGPGNLRAGELAVGAKFPDPGKFALEGRVPGLAGKVVLVDFWASWCAPCRESFPQFDALQKKYGARGFLVVGISVDEDAKAMKRFLEANKVSFAVARDAGQKLVAAAGPGTMPTSFLLDQAGTIRRVEHGFHGKQTVAALESAIQELLAGKH